MGPEEYIKRLSPTTTNTSEKNTYESKKKISPETKKVRKEAQDIIDSMIDIGDDFFENKKYREAFNFIHKNWLIITQEQVDTFKDRVKEYLKGIDLSGYKNIDLSQNIVLGAEIVEGRNVFIVNNENEENKGEELFIYNGE